jgi:hypothetical protein
MWAKQFTYIFLKIKKNHITFVFKKSCIPLFKNKTINLYNSFLYHYLSLFLTLFISLYLFFVVGGYHVLFMYKNTKMGWENSLSLLLIMHRKAGPLKLFALFLECCYTNISGYTIRKKKLDPTIKKDIYI